MKRLASMLLAGAILLTGCGGAKTDSAKSGGLVAVTLASISPLSGPAAAQGESIRFGAELAVKDKAAELEKAGYKVSFLAMDDQDKPEQGTQLAEQLITKKEVLGVVGTLSSGVAIPVSQKLSADNIVIVSPANTATQVTDRGLPNMNRIVARDDAQGPAAAKFIAEKLKATSLFIIHDKTPFGQGLAEEVRKAAGAMGMKVDAFEGITRGEKDYSAVLSKLKTVGSPVIYYGGVYAEASQMLKQMKEKAVSAAFVSGDGIDSAELVRLAGDASNGVYFTSVVADISKTADGQAFAKRYTELAKKDLDSYSAYAYDCGLIIINALIEYGKANPGKAPSRKELAEAVRKTSGYKGIAGTHTFDAKGDDKEAKVFIYQFQNGKYPGTLIQ
ncbi:MAG TPA: branched-chain amino acid ABC transporter substrate-binding protein [Symbiobacteriaceae bacterium]|nr:branched-chain amino acid ABC transporter substrate-binding protein [Symbiobacteriaceae bacterium]